MAFFSQKFLLRVPFFVHFRHNISIACKKFQNCQNGSEKTVHVRGSQGENIFGGSLFAKKKSLLPLKFFCWYVISKRCKRWVLISSKDLHKENTKWAKFEKRRKIVYTVSSLTFKKNEKCKIWPNTNNNKV